MATETDDTIGSLATLLGVIAKTGSMQPPLPTGAPIGRYFTLSVLGAGGMGVVYSAYDPQLDRKVALKLVRRQGEPGTPGSDSAESRALREARALAKLVHPNVVTLYEADVHESSLYLAMELVDGAAMSDWLAEKPRRWPEIADLFAQAGAGLAAAHRAGIVHRDMKPHNILVGSDGRVRVADFGVARLAGGTERGSLPQPGEGTQTGAIIGTPAYMAPEQLEGGSVDARSDQYGFCAAMHEALYGVRPAKDKEPADAKGVPRWLRRLVARGLSDEPEARFADMDALLAALQRGRHSVRRRAIGAGLLVAAAAFAVIVARPWAAADSCGGGEAAIEEQWNPARREAARRAFLAVDAKMGPRIWADVERSLDLYATKWVGLYGESCRSAKMGEQSAQMLDRRMGCLQRRAAQLGMLATVFGEADMGVVRAAHGATEDLPSLDRCADLTALERETPPPADPAKLARLGSVRGEIAAAAAYLSTNRLERGLTDAKAALAKARAEGYPPVIAEAAARLGEVQNALGETAPAQVSFADAAAQALAGGSDEWVFFSLGGLAEAVAWQRRPEEAQTWLQLTRGALERMGSTPDRIERIRRTTTVVLWLARRYEEAIPEARAALEAARTAAGPTSARALFAENRLGRVLADANHWREAEPIFTNVVARLDERYGDHPTSVIALAYLAYAARLRHDDARSIEMGHRALEMARRLYGEDDTRFVVLMHTDLGETLLGAGRLDEAEREYDAALRLANGKGVHARVTALPLFGKARVAHRRGDLVTSLRLASEALDQLTKAGAQVESLDMLAFLAARARERGDLAEAQSLAHRGLAAVDASLGRSHPSSFRALVEAGRTETASGHPDAARTLLEPVVAIADRDGDVDPADAAAARLALADAIFVTAPDRARTLATAAEATFAKLGAPFAMERATATAWMSRHLK